MRGLLTAARSPRFASARFVLLVFFLSRAAVFLVDFAAVRVVDPKQSRFTSEPVERDVPRVFPEQRWEARSELGSAAIWSNLRTTPARAEALFPAFSAATTTIATLTGADRVGVGVLLSNMALLAAAFFVHALARRYLDEGGARRAVLLLLLFPSSVVLSLSAPDALLLCAIAGSLLAYEHDRLSLAAAAGALAALTAPTGLCLFPALFIGDVMRRGGPDRRRVHVRQAWLLLIPAAVAAAGLLAQEAAGGAEPSLLAGLAREGWTFPLWRLFESANAIDWSFTTYDARQLAQASGLVVSLGLFAAAAQALRRLDAAHALFLVFAASLALAGGREASMLRTAAALAPLHVLLGGATSRPLAEQFAICASAMLLAVHAVLWATWGWVG